MATKTSATPGFHFPQNSPYREIPLVSEIHAIGSLFNSPLEPKSFISLTKRGVEQKIPAQTAQVDPDNWIEGIVHNVEGANHVPPPPIQIIPSPAVIATATKIIPLVQEAVPNAPVNLEKTWAQRTLSANFLEGPGDVSYVARSVNGLVNVVLGQNDSHLLNLAGITSCFSIIIGFISAVRNYEKMEQAQKINDFWGTILGGIRTVTGATRVLTGFVFIPLRALSFAVAYTAAKTAAVVTAVGVLGGIATALGILVSALIAIPSAITVVKTISFEMKFKEKLDDKDPTAAISFLIDQLTLTEDDYSEILATVEKQESNDTPIDPEDKKLLTAKDWDFIGKHITINGLTQALINAKKTKEAELERNTSGETLTLVKDAMKDLLLFKLKHKLTIGDPIGLSTKIIEKAKEGMLFNKIFHGAIVVGCVLGAIGLILGTIFTGGAPIIVSAVLLVLSGLIILGVDGYCYFTDKVPSDFKDKLIIYLSSLVIGAACIAGTVLSGGIGPIIVCGILLISLIVMLVYDEYRCYRQAKEDWELRNPPKELP